MSTTDSKKVKRRKNKAKGENSSSKLANIIPSNLVNCNNRCANPETISKIERMMDAGEDPLPVVDMSHPFNPFFTVNKCLMCQREKNRPSSNNSTLDESWEEVSLMPYEIKSYAQSPLWICNECRCDMEGGGQQKTTKAHLTRSSTTNTDMKKTDTICSCQSCSDKRSVKCANHPLQLDESCSELSLFVKHVYRDGGMDWTEDKNHYELMLLDKLKQMVNRWCVNSSHELFLWFEFQVRDHVVELKMSLLTNWRGGEMGPFQAKIFMIGLLDGYAQLCSASKRLKPVVQELENDYLRKLNLSWELFNRRLFQTIIYEDDRVKCVTPIFVRHLNKSQGDEKELKNMAGMLQKFLKLDEKMRNVDAMWREAQPGIQEFNNAQQTVKKKLKSLNEDTETLTVQHKIEHQVLNKCNAGVHKSSCEECTLNYLLTCRLLPNAEPSLKTALSISQPFPTSIMPSMINTIDAAIIETSTNVCSSLSKEHMHCCASAFDLPKGIKKILGEENVKRLAQIIGCAMGCTGGGHHSLLCNSLSSHVDPSSEREPGDGASENSTPHHASTRSCCDENIKGQCHVCSLVANASVDHMLDSTSTSVERPPYETPCECHVCVQHADRATIPSVISSPLPAAALHLYPHIHGTNSDHSINSHLFKQVSHSHVHEVFTSLSATKFQSHDNRGEKGNAKSTPNDCVVSDSARFLDCCQSKYVQTSKTCSLSKDCSQLVTTEIETQKVIKKSTQATTTTNVSVKTQTQDVNKIDEATCSKCVTHNKAVQATGNVPCWSTGVAHHPLDHRVKHVFHNHPPPPSSAIGNGSCGVQKCVVDSSCCISECRHNPTNSNNRPTADDSKGTSVVHSCGHHNGHTHTSTTIKHICRESRCSFRESQSLSPSRPCSDTDHLRGGDGEDCLDDSCSEQSSSTSTSNTKDTKHCDCCYCEVFGHDVTTLPSTSRNYTEIRDKLRQRLNRKKMECKIMEPEPFIPKKQPQEDCRDLDSLISFINGNKDVESSNRALESLRKSTKLMKKLNKKLKKTDIKLESRIVDGKEDLMEISLDVMQDRVDGDHTCESNGDMSVNHQCRVKDTPVKSDVSNIKLSMHEKCTDSNLGYQDTGVDRQSKCAKDDKYILYKNYEPPLTPTGSTRDISCNENESGTTSPAAVERTNDRRKKHLMNISPSITKPSVMETKTRVEKQNNVPNSKLKKQLPYQNKNIETLPLVHGRNCLVASTPKTVWNVTRSPSPTVNGVQEYAYLVEKSPAPKPNSGSNERANSEPSPRKYRNVKDNRIKNEPAFFDRAQNSSVAGDGLSSTVNGILSDLPVPRSSPSLNNQCKARTMKKKQSSSDLPTSIDEVFLPRDIDLDNGELDEMERELEAFKRFCWNSVPVPNKEKIHFNVKDLTIRKKSVVECN